MTDFDDSYDPDKALDQQELSDPNAQLAFAIQWCDRPEVSGDFVGMIERAHARGANLDATLDDGDTPLTLAIQAGMGAPSAVRALLELGADASLRAANGWAPWTAYYVRRADRVVAHRMREIEALLVEHGADRGDQVYLDLQAAVQDGDRKRTAELLTQGLDLTFPILDALGVATRHNDLDMARLLLAHGASPDGQDDDEPCLVVAARDGNLAMVQLLVEAGADVARGAYGDPSCTAEHLAREQGHDQIADWLGDQGR